MARSWVRLATCVVSGAAFLVLNGCGAQPDDGYSTPPPSSYGSAPQAALSGGLTPPARRRADDSGLAGGPAVASADAGMAPIANPRDMSLSECLKVYGDRCRNGKGMRTYKRADGMTVVAMDPIANPEDMSPAERRRVYPARYAARAATAPARRRGYYAPLVYTVAPVARPAPKATAPKPVATAAYAPPATPVVAAKPAAPVLAPAATPAPPPAAPMTATDKLSAAVKGEATKGATLTVPDALAKGQPAKVTLTLPQDLLGVIQREAAKLGLTKQARKAEVSATLSGQGYDIDPPGKQTKPLAAGQATSFDWQVKPGAGEKAPLRADIDGTLTGKGKPMSFSLASLEQAVASAVDDAKAKAKGFKLPKLSLDSLTWPGMPTLDVGGIKAKTGNVSAALIALIALIGVWMMARGAGANRARAERRRKYRTMTDYGRNEMEPAEAAPSGDHGHDDHGHGYVNPMIAAAGGAALGAAAAHAHDDHHDGHGHDAHDHGHDDHAAVAPPAEAGHDDHGHDSHGHDAHGHDDHGHHDATHTSNDGHHGHDAHGADAHAADGHGEHGHDEHDAHAAPEAGHDDHGHHGHDDHSHDAAPATLVSADGHGHDEHGHDGHGTDAHTTDAHAADGHDDHHGHDDHAHKDHHEHEHA